MNRVRQLIQEIHRRSLWQVLTIYAVASWAVISAVGTVGDALGLPDWFPRLALGLLIVGLPVVLATAFVQEGVRAPAEDEGKPAAGADGAGRVLTWRNALGGGVVAFAVWGVVAAGWVLFRGTTGSAGGSDTGIEQSVAVLPFLNMSGDPDNEYFSDGITEEILNALAQLHDLRVPGRTSSFAFKGQNLTIQQIADTLDVAHVLEGSVRRDGGRVLITAQLVDARRDRHLWSETYERDLDDVFAIQREIAGAIADQLQVELGGPRVVAADVPTTSQEAHDLYLRGRYELSQRGAHVAEAIGYFEEAVEADPSYARAYGGLALARVLGTAYGAGDTQALREGALEAADRALALDSTLSEPHTARGYLPTMIGGVPAAERELRLAIELDPNDANAHHFLAWALMARGMWDEAEASITRAILIDPSNPAHRWRRANLYAFTGRWAECEADAREALRLSPDDFYARQMLALALTLSRQVDALRALTPSANPMGQMMLSGLEDPDRLDEALRRLAGVSPTTAAFAAAWLGRPQIALELVESIVGNATAANTSFGTHAAIRSMALTSLAAEPRFQAILERLRIEPD